MNTKAEIAALKRRITELEAGTVAKPKSKPEPLRYIDQNTGKEILPPSPGYFEATYGDLKPDGFGDVVVPVVPLPSYEERQATRMAEEERQEAEVVARRSEGLAPGLRRDPFGIVRDRNGNLASVRVEEERAAKEVMSNMAAEAPALRGDVPQTERGQKRQAAADVAKAEAAKAEADVAKAAPEAPEGGHTLLTG